MSSTGSSTQQPQPAEPPRGAGSGAQAEPSGEPTGARPAATATSCPRCGAPMRADQDWCLHCGAAVTTDVAGARGWRTPIALVGALLAVAAVALVIALVQLSGDDEPVARTTEPAPSAAAEPQATVTPAPTTAPATPTASPTASATATGTPAATPTATPSATPGAAGWPPGKRGYTVILWSATTRAEAEAKRRSLTASGAKDLGILHSDDFSSLRAGYWVVFSGTYDAMAAAQEGAKAAQGLAPGAYAKRVVPK